MATGRCVNIMRCSKAKNKEIQEVDEANFKCAECGKPLVECEGTPQTKGDDKKKGQTVKVSTTNRPQPKGKIIALIAAALVVLGGGGFGIFKACSSGEKNESGKTGPDTVLVDTAKKDTVKVDTAVADEPEVKKEEEPKEEPVTVEPRQTVNSVFGGRAKYDKAAGVITFSGTVTISLHDEDDNTLTFRRGDKIRSAKVSGGCLVGGEAVIGGESQLLSGISERL
ncbi:MAG: CD1107 family mobile element protein [Prevotella sp.]